MPMQYEKPQPRHNRIYEEEAKEMAEQAAVEQNQKAKTEEEKEVDEAKEKELDELLDEIDKLMTEENVQNAVEYRQIGGE